MRKLSVVFFAVILAASVALGQTKATEPQSDNPNQWGELKDGKFTSQRLGLSLSIPSEHTVLSTAEAEVMTKAGTDLLKQGSNLDKRIDEAAARTIKLISISEKPLGTPQNASFELVAVKQQPGVTANMNLAANLMLLKGSVFKLKRSLGSLKVGANSFAAAELEGAVAGMIFFQRMYVVMHRGYSVVCAITYSTDKQRIDMEHILSTLALKK